MSILTCNSNFNHIAFRWIDQCCPFVNLIDAGVLPLLSLSYWPHGEDPRLWFRVWHLTGLKLSDHTARLTKGPPQKKGGWAAGLGQRGWNGAVEVDHVPPFYTRGRLHRQMRRGQQGKAGGRAFSYRTKRWRTECVFWELTLFTVSSTVFKP